MRRIGMAVVLLFGLVSSNLIQAQTIDSDTVFIKRVVQVESIEIDTLLVHGGISPAQTQVLIGTRFLPYSSKIIGLLNNGLSPISLKLIEGCHGSVAPNSFGDYPNFKLISRDSSNLIVEVEIIANCCYNFLGEAEVMGKDTLNLLYTGYGGFCSCECCFTLQYIFNTSMEENYQVLKFVRVNGSKVIGEIPLIK